MYLQVVLYKEWQYLLGIMPYISASIIIQLLTGVTEYFKNLKAQGEVGRQKITQYTRYGTVILALIQGYGVAISLENSQGIVQDPGLCFRFCNYCYTINWNSIFNVVG